MTTPLLHVGFHKTGSTSLQNDLFVDAAKGFVMPWYGEVVHHFINTHRERFCPDEVRNKFFRDAREACDEGKVPVLSHEALCRDEIQCDAADRLAETFPEGRVLIGIREQKSAIRSHYSNHINRDGTLDIRNFLGVDWTLYPGFMPAFPLQRLEYHLLVQRYVRRFGASRVKLLPFELIKYDSVRYQREVQAFAKAHERTETPLPHRRKGHRAVTLEARRRINRFVQRRPDWGGDFLKAGLAFRAKRKLCQWIDRCAPKTLDRMIEQRLKAEIEAWVADYYADSNAELLKYCDEPLADMGYRIKWPTTSSA